MDLETLVENFQAVEKQDHFRLKGLMHKETGKNV